MDLVHAKGAMRFIIASSDGDFTHLAVWLRELGAKVIGVASVAQLALRQNHHLRKCIRAHAALNRPAGPRSSSVC
ncbi:NYN domain-containing protein [Roseinatronobacter monicus]|uniref:NYN domain-containing protein n=1 Tax=Roseinatronobacter monicus TaxID=393481 RepID=UPI001FEB126D